MKTITPTELQANTYAILDEILLTNIPVAVNIKGKRLLIAPVKQGHKLQNLLPKPDVIQGEPDDLVDVTWEKEVNLNDVLTPKHGG